MTSYSEESRAKVLRALKEGAASTRKIAERTGLSKTLVSMIIRDSRRVDTKSKGRSTERARGRAGARSEKRPLTAPSTEEPKKAVDSDPPIGRDVEGGQELNPESSVEEILIRRHSKKRSGLVDELGYKGGSDKAELEMLRARVSALTQSLQAANAAAARGSVAGESVAGRPSLASLREDTWRRFAGTVIDLPKTALRLGRERTIELVAGTLLADLGMLALGPPPTPTIARMRSATEHLISDRGKLAVMIGNDAAGRRLRTLFLQSVVKYYYGPSVQRLFEKSMETMLPSEMMNMMGQP